MSTTVAVEKLSTPTLRTLLDQLSNKPSLAYTPNEKTLKREIEAELKRRSKAVSD